MKYLKYLTPLFAAALLVSCGGGGTTPTGGSKTSKTSKPTSAPTSAAPTCEPTAGPTSDRYNIPDVLPDMEVDVDSISVGELHRDTLSGEIKKEDGKLYFDFYEVSDFHGAVNYSVDEKTIGLEKMADYFSKKRAENPGGTIVISSGDMYQGSAESNLTHGYLVNYAMNIMGFEAMAMGNHEFDWGIDWLKKNGSLTIDDYKIPYLGANIVEKSTGELPSWLAPSTIITRGDYKVGVIGTLGDDAHDSIMKNLVESLEFKPELEIAKTEAAKLRAEGCDIVVWTSHRSATELAGLGDISSYGINAVFGGHSHENSKQSVGGVPYVQTKNYGKGIAHVQLCIDESTKEVTCSEYGVQEDPYAIEGLGGHAEIKKVMDVYNASIDPIKSITIGVTDGTLDIASPTFSLTNLCVETMSECAKEWAKDNGNVEIVAALHNSNGGVRNPIETGPITIGDIYKSFPFDNEVVIAKVSASKLRSIFQKSTGFGQWTNDTINARSDIKDGEEYYIAATDFISMNYYDMEESEFIRTGYIVRDSIVQKVHTVRNITLNSYKRSGNPQFAVIR